MSTPPPLPLALFLDPIGEQLLAAIAKHPNDAATRAVFADWLEERGLTAAAKLVRVQLAIAELDADDPRLASLSRSLRLLAERTPRELRWVIARAPIENCDVRFELQCPKRWDALAATETAGVRFCAACKSEVRYAVTVAEARKLARTGACVAVDPAQPRAAHDLEPVALVGRVVARD
jgi:uncharacterized protein (TIGR02996 family)